MKKTKHTPEPWRAVNGFDRRWRIHSETVSHLAEVSDPGEANARRIVACVNACRDIDMTVLEMPNYSVKAELDTLDAQIAGRLKAESQRDELLAALKRMVGCYGGSRRFPETLKSAKQAIERVEPHA